MKKIFNSLLIAILCQASVALAQSSAGPAVIPPSIQQGVTPEKAVETLKGLFQLPTSSLNVKSPPPASPSLQQSLQQVRTGTEAVLNIDTGIQRLNAEIKAKLGIDIPVLVGALWDGITWIVRWAAGLLAQIAPR